MGLLQEGAADLGVSNPDMGYLISAYALGVVVGAPLLTALGARVPRKTMVLWLMVMFTVANFSSVLAPTYEWMLLTRFLSGLPHGATSASPRSWPAPWCPRACAGGRSRG